MSDTSSPNTLTLTAVVMTFNEEKNLEACLRSIVGKVDQIIVIDSFSTDRTIEIAKRYTSDIYQHEFLNYAKQYLWGMENCEIRNEWVLRIDADERWTSQGFNTLRPLIEKDLCDGVNVRMKIYFMGRWLRHGGMYPNLFLRVYKRSKGKMEDRWMDEHIAADGAVVDADIDVLECNYDRQENIVPWIAKHNAYSTREALENLISRNDLRPVDSIANLWGNSTERKRWAKERIYSNVPLFVRPCAYFAYRYFLQRGFMEGREGLVFHTLHAFWYRFVVDVKVLQIEQNAKKSGHSIIEVIREHWGIELHPAED